MLEQEKVSNHIKQILNTCSSNITATSELEKLLKILEAGESSLDYVTSELSRKRDILLEKGIDWQGKWFLIYKMNIKNVSLYEYCFIVNKLNTIIPEIESIIAEDKERAKLRESIYEDNKRLKKYLEENRFSTPTYNVIYNLRIFILALGPIIIFLEFCSSIFRHSTGENTFFLIKLWLFPSAILYILEVIEKQNIDSRNKKIESEIKENENSFSSLFHKRDVYKEKRELLFNSLNIKYDYEIISSNY